jgi:hypothetical protein
MFGIFPSIVWLFFVPDYWRIDIYIHVFSNGEWKNITAAETTTIQPPTAKPQIDSNQICAK